jgi:hypothetical protein
MMNAMKSLVLIYFSLISIGLETVSYWTVKNFSLVQTMNGTGWFLSNSAMAVAINSQVTSPITQNSSDEPGSPGGDENNAARGQPISKDTPHIITPRRSRTLNDRPILRWYEVVGVTTYTVRIQGETVNWEKSVDDTEVQYDGDPLQPGGPYILTVNANNGEELSTERFWVMPPAQAEAIQAQRLQLEAQLDGDAETIAIAQLYTENALFADALSLLEPLVYRQISDVSAYCMLKNVYNEIGLNDLARETRSQADALGGCSN